MMDSSVHSTRNSLSARLEELRSGMPQSPPNERNYSGYTTPSRYSGSFMPIQSQTAGNGTSEARVSLQRRFTASGDVLGQNGSSNQRYSVGQPTPPYNESKDINTLMSFYKASEQSRSFDKQSDMESLRQKKLDFERELEKFTQRQARDLQQLEHMARELKLGGPHGHVSEPTTPPSERVADYGFPSIYSRQSRYSSSSNVMSPPNNANRMSRSGSTMTSPPFDSGDGRQGQAAVSDKLPSKSVPGSRRGSNDRMSAYFAADLASAGQRQTLGSNNRYSMPASASLSMQRPTPVDDSHALDPVNTTKFLFDEDDDKTAVRPETVTSPGGKTYLQMQKTQDNFPILLRHTEAQRPATASQAALDLAGDRTASPSGWPTFPRHRAGQSSLPQNLFDQDFVSAPSSNRQSADMPSPPSFASHSNRKSMELNGSSVPKPTTSRNETMPSTRPSIPMQPSYSTSDIPTLKNPHASKSPQNRSAEDAFHKHNQSLGRIPPGAVNRTSRDLSSIAAKLQETPKEDKQKSPTGAQSIAAQASAATFGPSIAATMGMDVQTSPTAPALVGGQYGNPAYFGSYGMQFMNMQMTPSNGPSNNFAPHMYQYPQPNHYGFFPATATTAANQPNQNRNAGNRRSQTGADENSRFAHARIETYQGEIYNLCKDQHGCRYLQRQLETRDSDVIQMIFSETHQHVVELMTDPFGNYLCQKLLEHANDEQRTTLVNNAAPQMVKIALNQHGTRALQKMIEYITTAEQTQTIINALRDKVVTLIQDLNGNHVIQKCLNRLSAEDAQFIFDAVGIHCVVVGTHRHGCCVLQRCIDHASSPQRGDLIAHITKSAHSLVRDPFGNYVLQYIVDLKNTRYINPLVTSFQGHIVSLSKHKFSSNVIEKMLRGADPSVSAAMVDEMLANHGELEGMLKDQYANYVVQTALDHSQPGHRQKLVEAIRPLLPVIRQTPYGRRIQSKIAASEQGLGLTGSRPTSANEAIPRTPLSVQTNNNMAILPGQLPGTNIFGASPTSLGSPVAANFSPIGSSGRESSNRINGVNGFTGMSQLAPSADGGNMQNPVPTFNPFNHTNGRNTHAGPPQNFPSRFNNGGHQTGFGYF